MNENIKLFTSEAIQVIKDNKPTGGYKVLNKALDMAIEALQKQEPKKQLDYCICACGYSDIERGFNYCPNCGQRIDWSEESPGD